MAFADTIRQLPFTPTTARARGFLPPIMRGTQHILYLLGCIAEEAMPVTDQQAEQELTHASEHFAAIAQTGFVSNAVADRAALIRTAVNEARTEFPAWNADARIANLRDLANRSAQLCADLDRELVGLRDSDAGSSL